jgi:RecA/RadA recombinase
METEASDTSSEASYFEQEPISGAVLLDQELLHREKCEVKGTILTGCSGLDDYVLLGGLTPGRVVGLSAEDETFGLLVRRQLCHFCTRPGS